MKFKVSHLGALRQAEFEVGGLTLICGPNNTGKTYATYAFYGFLHFVHNGYHFELPQQAFDELVRQGTTTLNIKTYIKDAGLLNKISQQYLQYLPNVFASDKTRFETTGFECLSIASFAQASIISKKVKISDSGVILEAHNENDDVFLSLLNNDEGFERGTHSSYLLQMHLSDVLSRFVAPRLAPFPFMASAERTGAAIFQNELDFNRSRLIELLADKTASITPFAFFEKFKGDYPLAVRQNVDFIRDIKAKTMAQKSPLLQRCPAIAERLLTIIGGSYVVGKDGGVSFKPTDKKNIKLTLVESSSTARALLDLSFYVNHLAKTGDILLIDEPELNLHPSNQRALARVFGMLVNAGVKVFITTHSDYIVRELNTLIMLNKNDDRLAQLAKDKGYIPAELLKADDVRVYVSGKASILLDGNKQKSSQMTLTRCPISQEYGIELTSFDNEIERMNELQDEILWG